MNSNNYLRAWSAEWAALRTFKQLPLDDDPSLQADASDAPSGESSMSSDLTVSSGSGIADMLLRQFSAAITPDVSERSQGSPHVVLAGTRPRRVSTLLSAGQILHLKEPSGCTADRPLHALVLNVDRSAERILIAPFSPIPMPATDAELLTDLNDDSLKVICLWNARWIPADTAARSWIIGQASETLMADALALRTAMARKEAVPAALADRTGPPLAIGDERQPYLDEEEALWSAFASDE